MGTERALADACLRLLGELPGEAPRPAWADNPAAPFRGTPNHYALALAQRLLWAHGADGTREHRLRALTEVQAYLIDAARRGHYLRAEAIETLSPSHGTWHSLALAAIWLCARSYQLRDLETAVSEWWRAQIAHEALFATAAGEIWAPGARRNRIPGLPAVGLAESSGEVAHHTVRDVIYQLLRGLPLTSPRARRNPGWWASRYCASAKLVRRLVREGAKLPRGAKPVKSPVVIWNRKLPGLGQLAWCEDWRGAADCVFAVARADDGSRTWALSAKGRCYTIPVSAEDLPALAVRGLVEEG